MADEELYKRIGTLEQDCVLFKEQIKTLRETYISVSLDVKQIKERLLNRLPAWATLLITTMASLTTGLLVAFAKR